MKVEDITEHVPEQYCDEIPILEGALKNHNKKEQSQAHPRGNQFLKPAGL